jgi:ABC-type uncharacterized transport system fused permease/ATPase subunit
LGFDMESALYQLFRDEGITVVSTGHRFSLKQFHDLELCLRGRQQWTIIDLLEASHTDRSITSNNTAS